MNFTAMLSITGTVACSMLTIGSTTHSATHARSILPTIGLAHSEVQSGRTKYFSSSTQKGCECLFRGQHDAGHTTFIYNPISSLFDNKGKQTSWLGQAIATHAFGSSAANQFLFAYSHVDGTFGVDYSAKSLDAFPIGLFFNPPE